MASPHSIERNPAKAPADDKISRAAVADITKAARYTVLSMPKQSIGKLAIKYKHVGTDDKRYIAYAKEKQCVYGYRFGQMDRYSQSFVVCHETLHHAFGHIEQGAILYKRDPRGFSFKLHNIACDAQINYILEHLPNPDTAKETLKYGVRRCQELGIVNWTDIQREMRKMSDKHKFELSPVFEKTPTELTSNQIYFAMQKTVRQVADIRRAERREQNWDELIGTLGTYFDIARRDPDVLFKSAPVELGPIDLYDMSALLVRTFTESEDPADRDDLKAVPDAEWEALWTSIVDLAILGKADAGHIFTQEPRRRSAALWNAILEIINAFKPESEDDGGGENDEPNDEESIIDRLADELNAHDDLREAIEKASERGEGDLMNDVRRAEDEFRRIQAGAGSSDALMKAYRPTGQTGTPWYNAMRRMVSSALITKFNVDPLRPSRRTVALTYEATKPGQKEGDGTAVAFTPRLNRKAKAKRCVVILDTSGSMFCDRVLIERCISEMATICKRVNTVMTVIFADAEVCGVVQIGEAYELIRTLQPKGGGGTDFRPAIKAAEEMKPDLIVYLTDLCGTFPDRKPKTPVIWAFPPEFASVKSPWGQRLQLSE